MLSQFNQCKDAKSEYLAKHKAFMESISIRFSIAGTKNPFYATHPSCNESTQF